MADDWGPIDAADWALPEPAPVGMTEAETYLAIARRNLAMWQRRLSKATHMAALAVKATTEAREGLETAIELATDASREVAKERSGGR